MDFSRKGRSLIFKYIGLVTLFIAKDVLVAILDEKLNQQYWWFLLWLVAVGGVLLTELYRYKQGIVCRETKMHGSFLAGFYMIIYLMLVKNQPASLWFSLQQPIDIAFAATITIISLLVLLWTGFEVYRYARHNQVFTAEAVKRFYTVCAIVLAAAVVIMIVLVIYRITAR